MNYSCFKMCWNLEIIFINNIEILWKIFHNDNVLVKRNDSREITRTMQHVKKWTLKKNTHKKTKQ